MIMKKISILLVLALLFNIAFSVTGFAKAERTEILQENNFINYAEEDEVLPSGWEKAPDKPNAHKMLKIVDSEIEGEKCLAFDCDVYDQKIERKFSQSEFGKLIFKARVFFTAANSLQVYFTGKSDLPKNIGLNLYRDGIDDGQWHDICIVVDTIEGTVTIQYDEEEPVIKHKEVNFTSGVGKFYFANWTKPNTPSIVKFQHIDVFKSYTEAMPVKFSGKTVLNEEFEFSNGNTVKSGINTINITFDADLESVEEEMVLLQIKEDDDSYRTLSTAFSYTGKTVTLTCDPLLAEKEYKIIVSEGIVASNIPSTVAYETTFFTDEGKIAAQLDKNIQGGIIPSYIKMYENDFDDSTDFDTVSGDMGLVKGLKNIRLNNVSEERNEGYLTISPSRSAYAFDLNFGTYIEAGDYVKVSFEYKSPSNLPGIPGIQIYSGTSMASSIIRFDSALGDEPQNEWQTYHLEIWPDSTTSNFKYKLYRGNNGDNLPTSTYNSNGTNTTGIRIRYGATSSGEDNYCYFDNIKVTTKKAYITELFSEDVSYITKPGEAGLLETENMEVSEGVLKGKGNANAGDKLLHARLAKEESETATEVYFKAKMPSADKVTLKLGSDEFLLSDNNVFGGDAFIADTWQKYHIVINGNEAKLWRGEANGYALAISNYYTDSAVYEAIIEMISASDGDIIEIDDFAWTVYEEGTEPFTTELPNSVTAKIRSTKATAYKAYIIYSEYSSDNKLIGTQYKFVEVPANDEKSFDMFFSVPYGDEIAKSFAYLWEFGVSAPLTESVIVK